MADNYYGSDNPFMDFLELTPESAYYSAPAWGEFAQQSPGTKRYYQNQFQDVYNEFLGALGSQIRGGGIPTKRWSEYLDEIPFAARYAALTPQMAGRTTGRFSPTTRQIYF